MQSKLDFFFQLQFINQVKLVVHESVIIFDEIQEAFDGRRSVGDKVARKLLRDFRCICW